MLQVLCSSTGRILSSDLYVVNATNAGYGSESSLSSDAPAVATGNSAVYGVIGRRSTQLPTSSWIAALDQSPSYGSLAAV